MSRGGQKYTKLSTEILNWTTSPSFFISATFPNGDTYEGDYKNGIREGKGRYTFVAGGWYKGDWANGLKHGEGTFRYPDKSKYTGEWKEGLKHGHGTYTYPNGDRYCGSWMNDKRHGPGTYLYAADQTSFTGEWVNGECTDGEWAFHDKAPFSAQIVNKKVTQYNRQWRTLLSRWCSYTLFPFIPIPTLIHGPIVQLDFSSHTLSNMHVRILRSIHCIIHFDSATASSRQHENETEKWSKKMMQKTCMLLQLKLVAITTRWHDESNHVRMTRGRMDNKMFTFSWQNPVGKRKQWGWKRRKMRRELEILRTTNIRIVTICQWKIRGSALSFLQFTSDLSCSLFDIPW